MNSIPDLDAPETPAPQPQPSPELGDELLTPGDEAFLFAPEPQPEVDAPAQQAS